MVQVDRLGSNVKCGGVTCLQTLPKCLKETQKKNFHALAKMFTKLKTLSCL